MTDSREVFGAEIQYFRTDPEYWDTLLRRLKDTGLQTVTSYIPWEMHAVAPPDADHPAGVMDFDGKTNPRLNLRKYLDLVEKHDLLLNYRVGPFCCNEMDYGGYPEWVMRAPKDLAVWDHQDKPALSYGLARNDGMQPSYLHPDYLAQVRAWFAAADAIALPHLRANGGCIHMINLDNEVSYIVRDSFLGSDYNPVNVRAGGFWHQFLAEKYAGDPRNLPYGKRYRAFEDVAPPRSVPEALGRDMAWYFDWAEFKTWAMCRYLQVLRETHEANGIRGVTYMTNFNPHRPEGVPTRMPDFEKAVKGLCGYDFYRGVFMSYSGYHSMARVLKLMNASLKYTWSAEFMSGTWKKNLGDTRVSDDHMRFMGRCALAQGCKSISWFMFHDRDQWGDSPVSSHGHPRPSHAVLTETMALCFDTLKSWDKLVPQTDVGIVYDLASAMHCHVGDPFPCDDNSLHIGGPAIRKFAAGKASAEYEGLFRLVEQSGAQAGAIDVMHDARGLQAYKLVFLPGTPVLEDAADAALLEYVRGGGTLVVTGPWPLVDAVGKPRTFLGKQKPAGKDDEVTLTIGKGRLIWHREFIAQEPPEQESLESIAYVTFLLEDSGVTPHVSVAPMKVVKWIDNLKRFEQPRNLASAILHRAKGETVLFLLNHYIDAAQCQVTFGSLRPKRLVDLDTGKAIPVQNRKATVDLDRKSCSIYRVQ